MSISDSAENSILALIFNATAWSGIAQNNASPDAVVDVALSTADPTNSGTMSSSETTYTSYARVSRNRNSSSGGWTVSGTAPTQAVPATTAITFPAGTGGSGTVTNFSVGKTGGGAVAFFWTGTVSPSIVTGNGITPSLTTATSIQLD